MSEDRLLTIREASRQRKPLDGADVQALEGALTQAERQCDEAIQRADKAEHWRDTAFDEVAQRQVTRHATEKKQVERERDEAQILYRTERELRKKAEAAQMVMAATIEKMTSELDRDGITWTHKSHKDAWRELVKALTNIPAAAERTQKVVEAAKKQDETHRTYKGLSGNELGHAVCEYERACKVTEGLARALDAKGGQ